MPATDAPRDQVFASYVVDWAHYRKGAYAWSAWNFQPIAHRVDVALCESPSGSATCVIRVSSRRLLHLLLPTRGHQPDALLGECSVWPL